MEKKILLCSKTAIVVLPFDLPGYGKSDKGNYKRYLWNFMPDSFAEFCSQLKLSQVVLVGHSMGGQVAISAALKYPELVARLVLIALPDLKHLTRVKAVVQGCDDGRWGGRLTPPEQIRINYAYNFTICRMMLLL